MLKQKNSEFRAYHFIEKSLQEFGWNVKNPTTSAEGEVYTQNECLQNINLKKMLNKDRPENIVKIQEDVFWVIEAKQGHSSIEKAIKEAINYADKINKSNKVKCLFASGVAGSDNDSYLIHTYYCRDGKWEQIALNGYKTTGFIAKSTALKILEYNSNNIEEEEIEDEHFIDAANRINEILHKGAINKRNRAKVIASLLLALVEDEYLKISSSPTTLIKDINARVESILDKYNKINFAQEIALNLPTSRDNHIKHRKALVDAIQELKNLNIRSAINSNRDILGQFYETFLKYANDAKEIGIVLTPRHITSFASDVLNINSSDYVYDPTCGTGGFLVAAFDKVKQSSINDIENFKISHIYGVEQDPEIVALALVNMIFRGDGKSNIYEGNTFDNFFVWENNTPIRIKKINEDELKKKKKFINKVLMNPPFAQNEKEFEFVSHALKQMTEGGLLLAVLPTSTMCSQAKKEITWREELLKRHNIKAVIKLSEDLFIPNAHKGTYIVIIEAWKPHQAKNNVFFALMDDGFEMKKAKRLPNENLPTNIDEIKKTLKRFLHLNEVTKIENNFMGFHTINFKDKVLDCSPEAYLSVNKMKNISISSVSLSLANSLINIKKDKGININDIEHKYFSLDKIFEEIARGDCPPLNSLKLGNTPIISTTETNNGIEGAYSPKDSTIWNNAITIPANGSTYKAFYHPYEFCALPDVLICKVKEEFSNINIQLYLCATFNQFSWRFSYFRKCNEYRLKKDIKFPLPVKKDGKIDFKLMEKLVENTKGIEIINNLLLLDNK